MTGGREWLWGCVFAGGGGGGGGLQCVPLLLAYNNPKVDLRVRDRGNEWLGGGVGEGGGGNVQCVCVLLALNNPKVRHWGFVTGGKEWLPTQVGRGAGGSNSVCR